MQLNQIEEPGSAGASQGFALFALGFRPFFLMAGISAIVLMVVWLMSFLNDFSIGGNYGARGWHSHEMMFGYTIAVIAGFLLTAVHNWTQRTTLRGQGLAWLTLLWILGRVGLVMAGVLPGWLVAFVDIVFLPLLALFLAIPLVRSGSYPNLIFIPILLLLTTANTLIHLQVLGYAEIDAGIGMNLAIDTVVLLITIVGGRVIPFFIERGIPGIQTRSWTWVDRLSIATVLLLIVSDVFGSGLSTAVMGILAAFAAVMHGIRLWGWYSGKVWSVPILWVLFTGYAWLVVGFGLRAVASLDLVPEVLATHAVTAGAIGVLTLGMMARVALGHTGREMRAPAPMVAAFVLINLAAVTRVIFAMFLPSWYVTFILISGALWALAFLIFIVVYSPILLRPRVDGRPG